MNNMNAGPDGDGQILVTADVLGLSQKLPPFAKNYVNLREIISTALEEFSADVKDPQFPG
jgi:3-methyl-2-oxobutanoate hydroxymethyltransferase